MSSTDGRTSRRGLLGLGVGVAATGTAALAGLATRQVLRARRQAIALGADEDFTPSGGEERVVVADDDVPLAVRVDAGSPDLPTVLLVHGFALDARSWTYQRAALREAGYPVITYEHRGHGSSERGEPDSYTVDQLGRDLARVIDETAPEGPLALIGHSMGAMTIMAFADQQRDVVRDRVVAVGLLSTSAGGLRSITWGLGPVLGSGLQRVGPAAMAQLAQRQDLFDKVLRGGQDMTDFLVRRFSFGSPVSMSVVRLAADMLFASPLEILSAYVPGLEAHDKLDALEALSEVEVLVLNGTKDVLTAPEHSDEIVARLTGARHVIVHDAGHIVTLEVPDLVNDAILDLLRRGADRGVPRDADGGSAHATPSTVVDLAGLRRARSSQAQPRTRGRRGGDRSRARSRQQTRQDKAASGSATTSAPT